MKPQPLDILAPPYGGYAGAMARGLAVDGDVEAWEGVSEKEILEMVDRMPKGVRVAIRPRRT